MVSGKYSALSGAVAREQAMENITNNLANLNTAGFKKDRVGFAAILRGAQQIESASGINYSRIHRIGTDHSQGAMRETGNNLDLAIQGEGYFKVRDNSGTYFTRQGHFQIDENGMIKTADGRNLLSDENAPVQLDGAQGKSVIIDADGNVSTGGPAEVRVGVFKVDDTAKLKKAGNSLFQLEGGRETLSEGGQIVQGHIELSNINMMEEMVLMTDNMRKFEAYHKVLKSYSTIGEKQDELGTVG